MRFASHRAVQGVGIGVLALSLALTGCGGKKNKKKNRNGRSGHAAPAVPGAGAVSRTGLLTVDEVLPPADAMPPTLRTVKTEEARSGKAVKGCVPAGKCKGSVASGFVGWQSADNKDSADFKVIVFKNASQATQGLRRLEVRGDQQARPVQGRADGQRRRADVRLRLQPAVPLRRERPDGPAPAGQVHRHRQEQGCDRPRRPAQRPRRAVEDVRRAVAAERHGPGHHRERGSGQAPLTAPRSAREGAADPG